MNGERRSAQEIRASLWENRNRLDRDLEELDTRVRRDWSPRELFLRHPALFGAAGAIVGFVLIRHPALLTRGLLRAAQVSAPFVVKSLLKRG
jgi:hypothetical protein